MRLILFILFSLIIVPACHAWDGIVIHHTASDSMTLDQCNEWHNARGWDGCGYNYVLQRDGTIETARGEKIGAHAKGRNRSHLGIALVGHEVFTDEQIKALRGFIKRYNLQIEPHHEQCPTKEWDKLKRSVTS